MLRFPALFFFFLQREKIFKNGHGVMMVRKKVRCIHSSKIVE
jgi:hypothetical protein